jgi:hypothetical protein
MPIAHIGNPKEKNIAYFVYGCSNSMLENNKPEIIGKTRVTPIMP